MKHRVYHSLTVSAFLTSDDFDLTN